MPDKWPKLRQKQLWLIAVTLWTCIGAFHYFQFYLQHVNSGSTFLWLPTLVEFVANYYSWVLIGFCVVWLGREFPFRPGKRAKALLIHSTTCVIFALLHLALVAILLKTFKGFGFKSFTTLDFYIYVFLWLFHFEVLMYWTVLGLSYGFQYFSEAQKHEGSIPTFESPVRAEKSRAYHDRILIKNNGHSLLLDTSRVDWMEAADNYINIHVGDSSYLLREKMHVLERKLDPRCFQRIHRSIIVNLARIREVRRGYKGDYSVILDKGEHLQVSRRRREQLQRHLQEIA